MGDTWVAEDTGPDIRVLLTTKQLDPVDGIEFVRDEKAGAIIMFGGTTRNNFEGKSVQLLSYEAHTRLALRSITKIVHDAKDAFTDERRIEKIHKVYVVHRLGRVPVKEESIVITLSSTHRDEGWKAASWILDNIKAKAEIWKSEVYDDGTYCWKRNES